MRKSIYRNSNYMSVVQRNAQANPRNFSNARNFSNYAGDAGAAGVGMINPNNNTITYTIVNASNATGIYVLFGADQFGSAVAGVPTTSTQSAFVSTSVQESSAAQVCRDTEKSPIYIAGCMISTSDVAQFNNQIFNIGWKSSSGASKGWVVSYAKFRNPANNQNTLLVATPQQFSLLVDGMTNINGNIVAGCTLTYTFYLGGRLDPSQVYNDGPIVSLAGGPFMYGVTTTVMQAPNANSAAAAIPLASRLGVAAGPGTSSFNK